MRLVQWFGAGAGGRRGGEAPGGRSLPRRG